VPTSGKRTGRVQADGGREDLEGHEGQSEQREPGRAELDPGVAGDPPTDEGGDDPVTRRLDPMAIARTAAHLPVAPVA